MSKRPVDVRAACRNWVWTSVIVLMVYLMTFTLWVEPSL